MLNVPNHLPFVNNDIYFQHDNPEIYMATFNSTKTTL